LGFFLFVNQFGYIMALHFMSATLAAVLQQVALFTFLLSVAVGLEAWSWVKVAGVLCAVGGCVVVELVGGGGGGGGGGGDGAPSSGGLALGAVCIVAAAFSMAAYFILQRPLLQRYSPLSVTAWVYGVATVCTALALPFSRASLQPAAWRLFGGEEWVALAVAVLGNSCLKYYLQAYANRGRTSVNAVAVFGALPPILTAALEFFFLNAPLQVGYLGALPILAGVALVVTAKTTARDPATLWAWQRALLGKEAGGAVQGADGSSGGDGAADGGGGGGAPITTRTPLLQIQ
jgi:drug/metabolite transporter (DMT)-like permease